MFTNPKDLTEEVSTGLVGRVVVRLEGVTIKSHECSFLYRATSSTDSSHCRGELSPEARSKVFPGCSDHPHQGLLDPGCV